MKKLILIALAFLSIQSYAQNISSPPSGSVLVGQSYLTPTENIIIGNGAKGYKFIPLQRRTDSLFNLKLNLSAFSAFQSTNTAAIALKQDASVYNAYVLSNNNALGLKLPTETFNTFVGNYNTAIDGKVDKVSGSRLITTPEANKVIAIEEVFTATEKTKLAGLGAQSTVFLGTKSFYGAKADAVLLLNGSTVAGSNVVNAIGANFVSGDVGKSIGIPYAGADNGTQLIGQTLLTTITAVNSPTQITISVNAVKTIVAARTITDGVMAINSKILTSATANFTAGDIGKKITIPSAGELQSNSRPPTVDVWITGINSATSVNVTRQALQAVTAQTITIPGAWVEYGTDDSNALQAGINDAASRDVTLLLENGRYLTTKALIPVDNLSITGQGRNSAILSPVGFGFAAFQQTGASTPLVDNSYQNFTIDGMGVTANTYTTANKGLYITNMLRPIFRDLIIMNTSATSIGTDFLRDYAIIDNVISHGGRQVPEFGSGGGGSGIGVGTGFYTTEAGLIQGNFVTDCGKQGIFVESQSSNVRSRGIKIIGNTCNWNGNAGIGDRATDGTLISLNHCNYNGVSGIEVAEGFVNSLYTINCKISNNYLKGNFATPILATYKDGNLSIIDNEIDGETTRGTTAGIEVILITGGTPLTCTIKGNLINFCQRRGVYIFGTGIHYVLDITGNKILNTGSTVGSTAPIPNDKILMTFVACISSSHRGYLISETFSFPAHGDNSCCCTKLVPP